MLLLTLPHPPPHPPHTPPNAPSCSSSPSSPSSSHFSHSSNFTQILTPLPLERAHAPPPLLAPSSTPRMLLTNPILPHLLQRACMFLVLTTITLSPLSPSQATVFLHPILSSIAMYVIQPITVCPLVLAAGDDKLSMNVNRSSRSYR